MPDILPNDTGEATINGSAADDWITPPTGGFLDKIYFSLGTDDSDLIFTAAGNDLVWITPGDDTLNGGDGYDALLAGQFLILDFSSVPFEDFKQFADPTFSFRYTGATIDTAAGRYEIRLSLTVAQPGPPETLTFSGNFAGFENYYGTAVDDLMIGSSGGAYWSDVDGYAETWRPGGGNDTINGRGQIDVLAYDLHLTADPLRERGISVVFTAEGAGTVDDGLGGTDLFSNIERVTGSQGSDVFNGSNGDDDMSGGGGGGDHFFGGRGTDIVRFGFVNPVTGQGIRADLARGNGVGGYGEALLFGGVEILYGSTLGDSLAGSARDETLRGFNGNDSLFGGGGDDSLTGDANDDLLDGGAGDDSLQGGSGLDRLRGADGADDLAGGDDADTLSGGAGDDTLASDAGDDRVDGDGGDDTLLGGDGDDTLNGGNSSGDLERLTEFLSGDAGDDRLSGGAGRDFLLGGAGNDHLLGGTGGDALNGDSGERITGRDPDRDESLFDVVIVPNGDDTLDGGAGEDFAWYLFAEAAINASLVTGIATGEGTDTLISIEGLIGSRFDDTLTGSADGNILIGGQGDDQLFGLAGDDIFVGSAGADTIDGGAGFDQVICDDMVRAIFDLTRKGDQLFYTVLTGSAEIKGDVYINIEGFIGSPDADRITLKGDDGGQIGGGDGADRLTGGAGGDTLIGGAGNDVLTGGGGADLLDGGTGRDVLTGGNGADIFVFGAPAGKAHADRITDFAAVDLIRLDGSVFKGLGTGPLGNAFRSHASGQAADANDRIIHETDSGALWYDRDGSGGANRQLIARLDPMLTLTAEDFMVI